MSLIAWLKNRLFCELAIDLGTTNTLVYLKGKGIIVQEPSVVVINRETGKVEAVGADLPISESTGIMIVDIGGGATDIAVISLNSIVFSHSIRIAGHEMDEAIIQYLKKKYNLIIGEGSAEHVKMQIGSAYSLDEPMTMEVKGRDLKEGIDCQMPVCALHADVHLEKTILYRLPFLSFDEFVLDMLHNF